MMKVYRLIALALLAISFPCGAKEIVTLNFAAPGGVAGTVSAVLRKPMNSGNGQALLLLHHAGGFDAGTTTQYAELFAERGFTTLELRMFDKPGEGRPPQLSLQAMMASGLRYLSQTPGVQDGKVSAMGLSLGAFMTISATSRWFYEHHGLGNLRFHRLAAVYPVCWMMSEATRGQTHGLAAFSGMPSDFLQSFANIPLLILAGAKDNYDGSNSDACPSFVRGMPGEEQARMTEVKVYPEAGHGWDHGHTYSFIAFNACPARTTCRNFNVFSPVTVEKGKRDMLAFFSQP